MLVRRCTGRAISLSLPASTREMVEAADIDLHMIEADKRQRVATTRELRAVGIEVRPFAAPRDFLDSIAELRPGCVILNAEAVRSGSAGHDEGALVLAQSWPTFITYDRIETAEALRLVRLGARDFLHKPINLDELRLVLELAEPGIRELRRLDEIKRSGALFDTLSARERAVVDGLAEGLSSKALAHRLKLSPRTVEMHRGRISRKLGVTSFAEVLGIAFTARQVRGD